METPYDLPNGLTIRVVDTETAGQALGNAVQSWHEGATEPLFYGSEGRPEGVVISFDQWAEYEAIDDSQYDGRGAKDSHEYLTPNGDTLYVNTTATVRHNLGRILGLFREGSEPVFFADAVARPEAVVISFREWVGYEIESEDAEEDRRRQDVVRRLEARDPSRKVTFEEAAREGGWDPDVPPAPPDVEADHQRRLEAALDAVITDGQYPLPNGAILSVTDIGTVRESLGRVLESFRNGSTEPVFFAGDELRPEGVIVSFDQWADYVELKEEAESDRRRYDLVRERLANNDPSNWVTYEELMEELGLDPDSDDLTPRAADAGGSKEPEGS
jgi:hypothetical protein